MLKKLKYAFCFVIFMFLLCGNVFALTGTVNVNDSLTLRDAPGVNGNFMCDYVDWLWEKRR